MQYLWKGTYIDSIWIGNITTTYVRHSISSSLPFPSGFTHDLSLITDGNLPSLTNPPKTPSVSGWGFYAAASDEDPLFVSRLNVISGRWRSAEGRGVSQAAQAAIPAGSEYSWTRQAVSQNTTLLWRTACDPECVRGYSGERVLSGAIDICDGSSR